MSKKTMTIPEFMQMVRIKEFNSKRSNKRLYSLVVLFILLIITSAISSGLTAPESVIAFSFNSINF